MVFEIGQKVVCVDDKFEGWLRKLYDQLPVAAKTYVVRDVRIGVAYSEGKRTGAISILVVGLVNPKADSRAGIERGFNSDRFRSLEEMRSRKLERTGIGVEAWDTGEKVGEVLVEV